LRKGQGLHQSGESRNKRKAKKKPQFRVRPITVTANDGLPLKRSGGSDGGILEFRKNAQPKKLSQETGHAADLAKNRPLASEGNYKIKKTWATKGDTGRALRRGLGLGTRQMQKHD